MSPYAVYITLLQHYGPQGWWPLSGYSGRSVKIGVVRGYHPDNYAFPRTETERFEICVGALLTQNTSWMQTQKAVRQLSDASLLVPQKLLAAGNSKLERLIRPAGYFRQKAKKLKLFAAFFLALKGRTPSREELLALWGVGRETADSMLLYAYRQPSFVVDAYTRRICARLQWVGLTAPYDVVQRFFTRSLPCDYRVFQEYHALLVEHAKRYYRGKRVTPDPLLA